MPETGLSHSARWVPRRRTVIGGALAGAATPLFGRAPPVSPVAEGAVLTPEMFGAVGDGKGNDSAAFARLAAHVSAQGGGTVVFRRTTYLVGAQRRGVGTAGWAFAPEPLLEFTGCHLPLVLHGNGARLLCADGLRYGTFDRMSGEATHHPLPAHPVGELASPYRFMILVRGSTGTVQIADLELDGNLDALSIGGPFGDKGRQIFASGLSLQDNRGSELVRNVYSHHHAQDGLYIVGVEDSVPGAVRRFDKVRAEHNVRQGCSLLSGRDYVFADCSFSHTGKAGLMSPPGAGVDIEPRPKRSVRGIRFDSCVFADNAGVGMVADRGDSADVTFDHCRFVATSNWGVWPKKPGFLFRDCDFVGAIVRCFGSLDERLATRFERCSFSDDPAEVPGRTVFLHGAGGPIADLGGGQNVRFDRCSFLLRASGVLPWSTSAIYADCTMRQASPREAYPRGTYTGRNTIIGKVDIAHSAVRGTLTINGKLVPPRAPQATPSAPPAPAVG